MENKRGFADKYFLEKIYLSGYKSIRQTKIELKSNFNIIIGKNGAGKTNFLEFLNKVLNDDINDLYEFRAVLNFSGKKKIEVLAEKRIPENIFEQRQFIVNDGLGFTVIINGSKTEYDNNNNKLNQNLQSEDLLRSSTLVAHGVPIKYDFVSEPFGITIVIKEGEWLAAQVDNISYEKPYFINSILYSFFFNERSNNFAFRNKIGVKQVESYFLPPIFDTLNALKTQLQNTSPISNIKFNKNPNIFENVGIGEFIISNLFIEFEVNGNWYPFSKLSDGTKRLFYIISEVVSEDYFFFRYSNFGEANSNSRIILIEEPELGIHPHQLHKLMLFLKEQSQTKQIIITTHSPEVLNILNANELDSIILSTYDKEKGTLLRNMTDKEKLDAKSYIKDMYLSDYWMHSNLEPAN